MKSARCRSKGSVENCKFLLPVLCTASLQIRIMNWCQRKNTWRIASTRKFSSFYGEQHGTGIPEHRLPSFCAVKIHCRTIVASCIHVAVLVQQGVLSSEFGSHPEPHRRDHGGRVGNNVLTVPGRQHRSRRSTRSRRWSSFNCWVTPRLRYSSASSHSWYSPSRGGTPGPRQISGAITVPLPWLHACRHHNLMFCGSLFGCWQELPRILERNWTLPAPARPPSRKDCS